MTANRRERKLKGWMQTMIVHTREPRRYFRELGFKKGVAGLTLIAGTVMTGLFGPGSPRRCPRPQSRASPTSTPTS
jgi:hypothetical protein